MLLHGKLSVLMQLTGWFGTFSACHRDFRTFRLYQVLYLFCGKESNNKLIFFSEVLSSTQSHFSYVAIRSIPKVMACLFCNEVLF